LRVPRYRFAEFVLSPRRRALLRGGRELPLIPRYFDLLVFLVERRGEAIHRREIFDRIWTDVVVSDSALSQAIRTIRRTLADDSREPRFVRTVSRHGYSFVFVDVVEEDDDGEWPVETAVGVVDPAEPETTADPFEALLRRISRRPATTADEEEQREAAELLHGLGTVEALRRLGTRPGHAFARALLRDTRWDVPQARPVPIAGAPGALATARELIALRLRRAAAMTATRWAAAATGGGVAGLLGGSVGGILLAVAPDGAAPAAVIPVLALIGAVCGGAGGAGVGAGLAMVEAVARSRRTIALTLGAALGGGVAGAAAQWLGRWSLATLVGVELMIGGALEGLILGAAAGVGFSLATRHATDGLAAPRGRRRVHAAAITAACCGAAALGLTLGGRPLVGGTIHLIAEASRGSQAALTPLARLLGESEFGPLTASLVGTAEGALFGFGLATGLTRRRAQA
jgi:DNA-binding winged helix-turn-helix (wHTH) protein